MRSDKGAQLALVVHESSRRFGATIKRFTHVGAVLRTSSQKVSTYERLLKIEELFRVTPTPIGSDDLGQLLPAGQLDHLLAGRVKTPWGVFTFVDGRQQVSRAPSMAGRY